MKDLFFYNNDEHAGGEQQILLLSLSENNIGCSVTDRNNSGLIYLAWTELENGEANPLPEFAAKHPVITRSFHEIKLAFDYPRQLLLPGPGSSAEEAGILLDAQCGRNPSAVIVTEPVPGWPYTICYSVPEDVHRWVKQMLPAARCRHYLSDGIRTILPCHKGEIRVDFRAGELCILVARDRNILLMQYFAYTTAADVIYFLLRISRQFFLPDEEHRISLSGLLDRESALYREIQQYFLHTSFREAGWGMAAGCPAHYFTSLNDLAQCE